MAALFVLFVATVLACVTAICVGRQKAYAVFVITLVLLMSAMSISNMLFAYKLFN